MSGVVKLTQVMGLEKGQEEAALVSWVEKSWPLFAFAICRDCLGQFPFLESWINVLVGSRFPYFICHRVWSRHRPLHNISCLCDLCLGLLQNTPFP